MPERSKHRSKASLGAWRVLVVLITAFLLMGCRNGPKPAEVESGLQARLDKGFGQGVFKIQTFSRRGSYNYTEDGDPRDRVLVYYKAEIRFEKEYKLSNWDELNVGSLISVLGATPLGVEGVEPVGNKQGDMLLVRGASAYAKENDGSWKAVAFVAGDDEDKNKPKERKGVEELATYRQHMEAIAKVGAQFQRKGKKQEVQWLEGELARVLAQTQRRQAKVQGVLSLATGSPTGEYFSLGRGLAGILTKQRNKAESFGTSGSMENCKLVQDREVQFAFAQNDIAYMAHTGTNLFKGQIPMADLRAIAALYPEAVQIVTLASAQIGSVEHLKGKRIDIGLVGSGIRINALQVFEAAGIDLRAFPHVQGKPRHEAFADLREGRIDALFVTAAYPAPALVKLATSHPIRLVPLAPELAETLKTRHPFFAPVRIPRNTYPDMEQEGLTVAVTAMLVTHKDTPGDLVQLVLKTLFENTAALSKQSLPAYYISADKAAVGASIPMHPAAEQYFKK